MRKTAAIASITVLAFSLLLLFAVPAVFAQGGGRGGGGGGGHGGGGRGGGFGGAGIGSRSRGGGFVGGGGGRGRFFGGPGFHHRFHRNVFVFGFGAGAYVPGWWWYDPWWYDPYYYWGQSPADYGYPYYDYYGYPYYDYSGYPYGSDPCLTSDPAYAPYCPPTSYPYQGGYDAPPVNYPSPEAPTQPETGGQPPPPPAPAQPTSPGY